MKQFNPSGSHAYRWWRMLTKFIHTERISISFLIGFAAFSIIIFFRSFSSNGSELFVGSHNVGDFSVHIPLIRSFSRGDMLHFEYPTFPGEHLRYHFLFYWFVAILEGVGIRIDLALNGLTLISLISVVTIIILVARKLAGGLVMAGILAGIFFVFNSSFSWWYYLFDTKVPFSLLSLVTSGSFASIGPYDGKLVSIFWNWNVLVSQRHLSFAGVLLAGAWYGLIFSKYRWQIFFGLLCVFLLSWTHIALFAVCLLGLCCGVLFSHHKRRVVMLFFVSIVLSIPALLYFQQDSQLYPELITSSIAWRPGFLADRYAWTWEVGSLTSIARWSVYWVMNWGVLPLTALIGFVVWVRSRKSASVASLGMMLASLSLLLFIVANTFQLSADMINNHKLLNVTQVIWSLFSAVGIGLIVRRSSRAIFAVPAIVFVLTFGGLLDALPLVNAVQYQWQEVDHSRVSQWASERVGVDERVFNLTFSTIQVSLAGRQIWYGWPVYPWSLGYNVDARRDEIRPFIAGEMSVDALCEYVGSHRLAYAFAYPHEIEFLETTINFDFFASHFPQQIIENSVVYDLRAGCAPDSK